MTDCRQPASASEWLIALHEAPEDSELQVGFDAWLAADSDNQRDWREISRVYDLIGQASPAPAVTAVPEAAASLQGRSSRRRVLALAGGALAAALALFIVARDVPPPEGVDYVTETAETRSIELADGSLVRLGPESALAVDFTAEGRFVELFEGEAYFDVARNPEQPFHVTAGGLRTRVLGTAFEVQLAGNSTEVAVREGRVEVGIGRSVQRETNLRETASLGAGDWLRLEADGRLQRGQVPPDQVAAWLDGRLIARDRPVDEVVEVILRYHSGFVLMPGAELAGQRVTGVYDLFEPVDALRAVAGAQGAHLHTLTPWLVVLTGW